MSKAPAGLGLEVGMPLGESLEAHWADMDEYDVADLLGHSTTPGETRNTKVTRGYAHGVPQRLRDAVNSLEKGKHLISGTPTGKRGLSRDEQVNPTQAPLSG